MARLVVVQQRQLGHHSPWVSPHSSLLPSSLSEFNGTGFSVSLQNKRRAWRPKGGLHVSASSAKNILIMGGTRFIGVFLSRLLVKEGHQVTLFTRGKAPITQQLPGESDQEYAEFSSKVLHLKGDRQDFEFVKTSLSAKGFDVVYDINGREAVEVEPILDGLPKLEQYIYCSSAGVYLKSDLLPHFESDAVDPKSRHKGKLETESLLESRGVNWTSIRPVYIYGPLNYNPVEEWFFHRLKAGRPIPIPNSGVQITQLGHVKLGVGSNQTGAHPTPPCPRSSSTWAKIRFGGSSSRGSTSGGETSVSELQQYLNAMTVEPDDDFNILAWWKSYEGRFSVLSTMDDEFWTSTGVGWIRRLWRRSYACKTGTAHRIENKAYFKRSRIWRRWRLQMLYRVYVKKINVILFFCNF